MTASAEFTQYVMELLEPVGALRANRFFGGVGIAHESVQFAMIMGNRLYFAVDERTRAKFERAGTGPFSYATRKGRVTVCKYFELPANVLEDRDTLRAWARESIEAAARTAKGKPGRAARTAPGRGRRTRE